MPRASANISAKFNAQMLTGAMLVDSTSAPAATSRPASVSISGSPAATRLPNAITSTIIVTGQDSTSDLIIAAWLTLLKFAHSALEPVTSTEMPLPDSLVRGLLRSSAARTISLESAVAPAWMIAVLPSREMLTPGCGATTVLTRGSALSSAVALAIACCAAGSPAIARALSWTTTCKAVELSPLKFLEIRSRAWTEELVLSCQPAPDRADSTCGAKAPNTARMISHDSRTTRRWLPAHAPSRASHPVGVLPDSARRFGWTTVVVTALLTVPHAVKARSEHGGLRARSHIIRYP